MVLLHLHGLSHGLLAALLVVLALAYPGALHGEDLAHLPPRCCRGSDPGCCNGSVHGDVARASPRRRQRL
ncbi:hypothetical protein PHYSODRAFT_288917, partial [Phytophthora sojae]